MGLAARADRGVPARQGKLHEDGLEELKAFAKAVFDLNQSGPDGKPVRVHFEKYEEQTGNPHPRLELPPFPTEFSWHWTAYAELSEGRTQTGWGASPLTWLDMQAWASLKGVRLSPLDVTILRTVDEAWLTSHAEAAEKRDKASRKPEKHG